MVCAPRPSATRARTVGLTALAALGACVNPDAANTPNDPSPLELTVPSGSSMNGLGPRLVEEGLIPSVFAWKWYLRSADSACLKAGRFALRHDMTMSEVRATLCGPPLPEDVPFTVLEGWRIRDVDAALTERGWIEAGAYAAVAEGKTVPAPFEVSGPTYEGYLYPDTYRVLPPPRFTPEALVARQLAALDERFVTPHAADFTADRPLHDVVIMASMLEREEPSDENRPLVAGILYKRIAHGWQLGVDATSRYQLSDWNDRHAFLTKLADPADPYNTRVHKGLPPTAIGAPSMSALEAALAPVPSPYWYYLHDHNGTLHPSRNADEHDAARRRYDVH